MPRERHILAGTPELLTDAEIDAMIGEARHVRVPPIDPKWDVRRIARTLDYYRLCIRGLEAMYGDDRS